jgi:hypothetical protein
MVTGSSSTDNSTGVYWYLAEDAVKSSEWRKNLSWPVTPTRLRELGESVCIEALALANVEHRPVQRQILSVGLATVVSSFMALAELAYVADASKNNGVDVISPPPEYEAFSTSGKVVKVTGSRNRNKGIQDVKASNWALLRCLVRSHSWSGLSGLWAAALGRDGWALSHNNLLISYLKNNGVRASFRSAANIVAACRKKTVQASLSDEDIEAMLLRVVSSLVDLCTELPTTVRGRFCEILMARLLPSFRRISTDIAALQSHCMLPDTVWTGTNGSYATRVVVSEVRRRGGTVNTFDHGGVSGISQVLPLTAIVEGVFSTAFYVGTPKWRDLLVSSGFPKLLEGVNNLEIRPCDGEPTFQFASIDGVSASSRRRAMYVSHPYYGYRQFAIPAMRDTIYMDFQIDLINQLNEADVDLMLKPHPEGHFGENTYPLQHMAATSFQRFEEHIRDVDIFVFDAPTSTTFCEALCTRMPVILIERSQYPINPVLMEAINRRCILIKPHYVDGNRLRVDSNELASALEGAPTEVDPSYFRELLANHPPSLSEPTSTGT